MSINRNKDFGITSSFSRVIKISDAETDEIIPLVQIQNK